MPQNIFEQAEHIALSFQDAAPTSSRPLDTAPSGKLSTYVIPLPPDLNVTVLPLLEAAITMADKNSALECGKGEIRLSVSNRFTSAPAFQIRDNIRNLQKTIHKAIERRTDGTYVLKRTPEMSVLNIPQLVACALATYQPEINHQPFVPDKFTPLDFTKGIIEIPLPEYTPYYHLPPGVVYKDPAGLRHHGVVDSVLLHEFLHLREMRQEPSYAPETLVDHLLLNQAAMTALSHQFGIAPEKGATRH